jgi:hypothetical protein
VDHSSVNRKQHLQCGKVIVETKGGKLHHGKLDPKAMGHVRRSLRIRPETVVPTCSPAVRGQA